MAKKSKDQYYTLIAQYLTGDFKGTLVQVESPDSVKAGSKMNIRLTTGDYVEILILSCTAE
jgi:hypothetical protein